MHNKYYESKKFKTTYILEQREYYYFVTGQLTWTTAFGVPTQRGSVTHKLRGVYSSHVRLEVILSHLIIFR